MSAEVSAATGSVAMESLAQARAAQLARGGDYVVLERSAAWNHFVLCGLPRARSEGWKYTPPGAIFDRALTPAPLVATLTAELPPALPGAARLVFVNGKLASAASTSAHRHLRCTAASPALQRPSPANGLRALNRALYEDAAVVELPAGEDGGTVELVHVVQDVVDGALVLPRVFLRLGEGAKLKVVESFVGASGATYLVNAVTEVELGARASLEHYAVQAEGARALHVSALASRQQAHSRLLTHSVQLGAATARRELTLRLDGEGASVQVEGLTVGRAQHHDLHVRVDHLQPACQSRQRFRAVLDAGARGVFTGHIDVHPGAQKTDAGQSARALLLTEDAEADLRPHLEIHADDVKANHGATVGELDPEQVFYLRSRGIPEGQARALLTSAFVHEVVAAIELPELRERVEALLAQRLTPEGS